MAFTKGRLLVATPPLVDPNFDRTIVFVIEHNAEGAFGLVINRPTTTQLTAVLPGWSERASWPTALFSGGPVQTDAIIGLALVRDLPAEGWQQITGDLGTVDLAKDPDEFGSLGALRVFVGYSGWGPGQLEAELSVNAWIVVDADQLDPFSAKPSQLWRHVLGRQPGSLGWMGNYPDDVSTN